MSDSVDGGLLQDLEEDLHVVVAEQELLTITGDRCACVPVKHREGSADGNDDFPAASHATAVGHVEPALINRHGAARSIEALHGAVGLGKHDLKVETATTGLGCTARQADCRTERKTKNSEEIARTLHGNSPYKERFFTLETTTTWK